MEDGRPAVGDVKLEPPANDVLETGLVTVWLGGPPARLEICLPDHQAR